MGGVGGVGGVCGRGDIDGVSESGVGMGGTVSESGTVLWGRINGIRTAVFTQKRLHVYRKEYIL
jgi:hypothetical protein